MEIDIKEYLSEDEIKEVAKNALRSQFISILKKETDLKRIITNTSYDIVYRMVDDSLTEDINDNIADKVKNIISNLTSYNVFKKPDAWDSETNDAYKHLQKCIVENFPKIKDLVSAQIETETMKHLKDSLSDYIVEAVQEMYKTKP